MKVLFAVNDENISTSIVKKYQKQYKEIISYKNVYYFNAIIKELQRNKSYDRVVISEDLEEFTSSSYEQKDKFIFDRLDNISDEAVTTDGTDIPIILICTERRTKSEDILVRLFGISIYNAILGDDRTTDEVCRLINKPRSKKEAKIYYQIDSENVVYQKGNDSDVSEVEMQNILRHFKRLGKDEDKYVESFHNIVSQYNDEQLKVIARSLPENVRAALEEKSEEYQKIIYPKGRSQYNQYRNNGISTSLKKGKKEAKKGTSEKLLGAEPKLTMSKPIVVPSTMEKNMYKKVNPKKTVELDIDDIEDEEIEDDVQQIVEEKPKRRGRPRKNPLPEETEDVKPKRRGRPRKNPEPENIDETQKTREMEEDPFGDILPGFQENYDDDDILPGFDEEEEETVVERPTRSRANAKLETLPGFDDDEEDDEEYEIDKFDEYEENDDDEYEDEEYDRYEENDELEEEEEDTEPEPRRQEMKHYDNHFDDNQFESLLTGDKKIVTFVGTSKNGTSFIVNNIALALSNMGVNTAILDATQNKNSYYIYTKNDEALRKVAVNSYENLIYGKAQGIKVNNNLTVYTTIPSHNDQINNSYPIMETLVKNHSIVLIDCDFRTPIEYFDKSQEIYLIQSMDVLTIQPLTEFLRGLKVKNVLNESKIRIILNKLLRVRGVSGKNIVGGMSNYNDPEMSFMTELFDRNLVKVAAQIPFDEDVYARYLEGLIECEIKPNSYPKEFKQRLNDLAGVVYPLLPNKNDSRKNRKDTRNNGYQSSAFSSGMNNTLDNMRKKY